MKKIMLFAVTFLCNALITQASGVIYEVPERTVAVFRVEYQPFESHSATYNIVSTKTKITYFFNSKPYYKAVIKKSSPNLTLDQLFEFNEDVDPNLKNRVTGFFINTGTRSAISFTLIHKFLNPIIANDYK